MTRISRFHRVLWPINGSTDPLISWLVPWPLCLVTGDNILTAISVARQCDMVDSREPVIMVNAYPAENDRPSRIDWGFADMDVVEEETPESQRSPTGEQANEVIIALATRVNHVPLICQHWSNAINKPNDSYLALVWGLLKLCLLISPPV